MHLPCAAAGDGSSRQPCAMGHLVFSAHIPRLGALLHMEISHDFTSSEHVCRWMQILWILPTWTVHDIVHTARDQSLLVDSTYHDALQIPLLDPAARVDLGSEGDRFFSGSDSHRWLARPASNP
jgi:hypothetical protein